MKSEMMPSIIVPKPQRACVQAATTLQPAGQITQQAKAKILTAGPSQKQGCLQNIHPQHAKQAPHFKQNQMQQLSQLLLSLSREVVGLSTKLQDIEMRMSGLESRDNESDQPKKKTRRRACDIEKNCKCSFPGCSKSYGSEISLNLHIKLKHKTKQSGSESAGNSKHIEQEISESEQECSGDKNNSLTN